VSETFHGYLHVVRTRKQPRGGGPLERLLIRALEDTLHETQGRPIPEHPPIYFFHVPDRTVGSEQAKVGGTSGWRLDKLFMFRFKGQPKLLDREMEGWRITVRGSYDVWRNGLGGHMKHYRVVDVSPPGDGDACPCKEGA
jgi:hypothetical protein